MPSVIPVGMSQLKTAKSPELLAVYGIGSCIILSIYDAARQIGGLAHIMLPDSSDRLSRIESEINRMKEDMNDILADQNDINEMTQAQLDAISEALAELQAKPQNHQRQRIGFRKDNDES